MKSILIEKLVKHNIIKYNKYQTILFHEKVFISSLHAIYNFLCTQSCSYTSTHQLPWGLGLRKCKVWDASFHLRSDAAME